MPRKLPPIHPGETLLEDCMKPAALSANRLAAHLHIPTSRILEIVNGRRGITADTALRLARYFGTTPNVWLNLQQNYDLARAQEDGVEAAVVREVRTRAEASA